MNMVGQAAGILCEEAAAQMGLPPGIAVGTSLIDAHSGSLASIAVG